MDAKRIEDTILSCRHWLFMLQRLTTGKYIDQRPRDKEGVWWRIEKAISEANWALEELGKWRLRNERGEKLE